MSRSQPSAEERLAGARDARQDLTAGLRIAVAIPCLNEADAIEEVVADFRRCLPGSEVYVVDNGSTDGSASRAERAGARVLVEKRRGKGYVVQTILEHIDADVYVLADGDGSHPAGEIHRLLEPILSRRADMVVGSRLEKVGSSAMRPLHQFGNRMIARILNLCFGTNFRDVLSGYRVLTREFVGKTPVITPGFEIETELTVQALEMGMIIEEVSIQHRPRRAGSSPKLDTFRDGYRILVTIAILLRDHRPLLFFSAVAALLLLTGLAALVWLLLGTVDNSFSLKLAILSATTAIAAMVALAVGFVLNAVNTRVRELIALASRKVHKVKHNRSDGMRE